ncbi:hypothetical protein P7D22_22035 [Lichenihabitans sp. Uapishka_5]|nr:hypothetical protein [Lichenihabitans sp. Uapishka_5]MDX7953841.1 hypothetical protein [Lichenihabitans sp. Uapishka_5]
MLSLDVPLAAVLVLLDSRMLLMSCVARLFECDIESDTTVPHVFVVGK